MTTQERAIRDRRSGKDRRKLQMFKQLFSSDPHHRSLQQRRLIPERRTGWVRSTRWSSIDLSRFTLSRYLKY